MTGILGDRPGLRSRTTEAPAEPVACDADFQLVADHYACTLEERIEIAQAWANDPPAAARCYALLAADIRDARAAGAAR